MEVNIDEEEVKATEALDSAKGKLELIQQAERQTIAVIMEQQARVNFLKELRKRSNGVKSEEKPPEEG